MAQTKNSKPARQRGFFAGRSVIVTGASSGIGHDVASSFARQGASVALIARREQLLSKLADEIGSSGGKALPIACDVTKAEQVKKAFDRVHDEFKKVDILVNNAGVSIPAKVSDLRLQDLHRMMEVNFYGTVHATQAVLPLMQKARRGNIVNVASLAGRRGFSPLAGYCASKFAVVGFTEALRIELFGTGITASLVMPGLVDTPMVKDVTVEGQSIPSGAAMPPSWVTWAVFAAVTLGLAEVDVPFGAATAEKLASLFRDMAGALLGFGARALELIGAWTSSSVR